MLLFGRIEFTCFTDNFVLDCISMNKLNWIVSSSDQVFLLVAQIERSQKIDGNFMFSLTNYKRWYS